MLSEAYGENYLSTQLVYHAPCFVIGNQLLSATIQLRYHTPPQWAETCLCDLDTFLQDHASAEKKASGLAITLISHYPDRLELVNIMAEVAVEELNHFREVIKIIHSRGGQLAADRKDPYIIEFRKSISAGSDSYFLDRLLVAGIIEARGAERFGLIAQALPEGSLQQFYQAITDSEQRHLATFLELAYLYHDRTVTDQRLLQLLHIEAAICAALPWRAALH